MRAILCDMYRPAAASLIVSAFMVFACERAPRAAEHEGSPITDVIILKYMYDPDEAALDITDPAEIEQLRQLIAGNPHEAEHACGYHWLICFRDPKGYVSSFAHNQDCEVYQRSNRHVHRVLRRYFAQIRENPQTFVFNVTIPASITPDQAVERTAGGGNTIFFLHGTDSRLPSVRLELSVKSPIPDNRNQWDAATEANRQAAFRRMGAVLSEVRTALPGTHHSAPENRYSSSGGGEIEDRVEARLYLPSGTSPQHVKVPADVRLSNATVPTSYIIQVATPNRNPRALKMALGKQLGADVSVAPYPETP